MCVLDTLFDEENTEASEEKNTVQRKDELSELRDLLLKPEQTQLEQVQERLDDPKQYAKDVSRVLPEAILIRSKKDEQITRTLTPILEDAVKASVRKNPKILVNTIFPVIGPAIRKAIATTLRGMVQSFSQMLDQTFSLKGLKWRLEAFRTGKAFAEVVLLHTLVYRVEQAFLIHRESGIALQHVAATGVAAQDPDLVSSMLTAIQDFIRDSFGEGRGSLVDTLQVGDHTVWIEDGPLAILAVVIRGNATPELRSTLQDVIETIHFEQEEELESFEGDTACFEAARGHLQDCFQAQYVQKKKKISPLFWMISGLIVIGLLLLLISSVRSHRRWTQYVDELRASPGIVVTSVEKKSGVHFIAGLRDPLAADPMEMLRGTKLDSADVMTAWEPYHSFSPTLVLKRANIILNPPSTVTLTFENSILTASGSAPQQWIVDARQRARFIPGVMTFRETDLSIMEDEIVLSLKERIEEQTIRFVRGSTRLVDAQGDALSGLVTDVQELLQFVQRSRKNVRVVIVGHTDTTGSETRNMNLSIRRAEEMLSALTKGGLPADVFTTRGVGSTEPLYKETTEADQERNRCVTFRVEIRNNNDHTLRREFP